MGRLVIAQAVKQYWACRRRLDGKGEGPVQKIPALAPMLFYLMAVPAQAQRAVGGGGSFLTGAQLVGDALYLA